LQGHEGTLKLLLDNTEEASVVDTPDSLEGATPLMLATAAGHSACIRSRKVLLPRLEGSFADPDPKFFTHQDPDPK